MAFVTGADIRAMLLGADPGVTVAQCDAFVADWIALVREAAPPLPNLDGTPGLTPETGTTRRIVWIGAYADAKKLQMVRDGYLETKDADAMLAQATALLSRYDQENPVLGEPARTVFRTGFPW